MSTKTALWALCAALTFSGCSDDSGSNPPLDIGQRDTHATDVNAPLHDTAPIPDTTVDRGTAGDSAIDAGPATDSTADTTAIDSTVDSAAIDSTVDASPDTTVDLGPDTTVDLWPDTTYDAGPDTTVDASPVVASISGTIEQQDGAVEGTEVVIRLYDSNAPEDMASPIAQTTVTATSGQLLTSTSFQFSNLAAGSYYLRAYRDAGGASGAPDGHPTLATDPQTPAAQVVITDGDVTGVSLTLRGRTSFDNSFGLFDARTINITADAAPPTTYTVTNRWMVGHGMCRGYYMRLATYLDGSAQGVTAPRVILPDGSVVTLLDDGGCSEAVADNRSSSYDEGPADGLYTYGIPSPQASAAGDYLFFYRQETDDFIHEEVDNIASVIRIPLLRDGVSPDATSPNANLSPTISWNAVTGANAYEVTLANREGTYENYDDTARIVETPQYTPTVALADDSCYQLSIAAYDALPDGDVDAYAAGSESYFCTDTDGYDSITVAGTLTNHSNKASSTVIDVWSRSDDLRMARVRVPAGATTYQISVLVGDHNEGGRLFAFVDAAGSGDRDSVGNASNREAEMLDLREIGGTVPMDLVLNPEPELSSPPRWARVATRTPAFAWSDYATTAGSNAPSDPFMLVFFIDSQQGGGLPGSIWVLPGDATAFDLQSPPSAITAFDVVAYANCRYRGGTYSVATDGTPSCSVGGISPSAGWLVPDTAHRWGLLVADCPFSLYTPGGDNTDFFDCVNTLLDAPALFFARSEERVLVAPQ